MEKELSLLSDQTLIRPRYLGLLSYEEGLEEQETAAAEVLSGGPGVGIVLGLEHQAVITLGKRGSVESDLRVTREQLSEKGIELHQSPRGGQATLHSPGQLVVYPIVSLKRLGCGVRDYVRGLEVTTQSLLMEHGIVSEPGDSEPGLYTEKGKIAFFGVRVSRGVTSHGISINVANDLSLFQAIRSCGVEAESFDKINDYRPLGTSRASLTTLFDQWIRHFRSTFRLTIH